MDMGLRNNSFRLRMDNRRNQLVSWSYSKTPFWLHIQEKLYSISSRLFTDVFQFLHDRVSRDPLQTIFQFLFQPARNNQNIRYILNDQDLDGYFRSELNVEEEIIADESFIEEESDDADTVDEVDDDDDDNYNDDNYDNDEEIEEI